MDFEELLGVLFVLYILGSMVAGFLRRGSKQAPDRDDPASPARRPGLPEVLDMDQLERRLRELALGRPDPGSAPEPTPTPVPDRAPHLPSPKRPVLVRTEPERARPLPGRAAAAVHISAVAPIGTGKADDWGNGDDDWSGPAETVWRAAPRRRRVGRSGPSRSLPPAIMAYWHGNNPWQAAFVVKEVLGPPRALAPHRGQPRF